MIFFVYDIICNKTQMRRNKFPIKSELRSVSIWNFQTESSIKEPVHIHICMHLMKSARRNSENNIWIRHRYEYGNASQGLHKMAINKTAHSIYFHISEKSAQSEDKERKPFRIYAQVPIPFPWPYCFGQMSICMLYVAEKAYCLKFTW